MTAAAGEAVGIAEGLEADRHVGERGDAGALTCRVVQATNGVEVFRVQLCMVILLLAWAARPLGLTALPFRRGMGWGGRREIDGRGAGKPP